MAVKRNISAAASVIKKEMPDILLLQEITADKIETLTQDLNNLHNGDTLHVAHENDILQAVISRYPIRLVETTAKKKQVSKSNP